MHQKQRIKPLSLGRIMVTSAVEETIARADIDSALGRHAQGDWGNLKPDDIRQNDLALEAAGCSPPTPTGATFDSTSSPRQTARLPPSYYQQTIESKESGWAHSPDSSQTVLAYHVCGPRFRFEHQAETPLRGIFVTPLRSVALSSAQNENLRPFCEVAIQLLNGVGDLLTGPERTHRFRSMLKSSPPPSVHPEL